jgi:DNA-binding NarL/FixJ family response regulator
MLERLRLLLEPRYDIVGTVADGDEVAGAVAALAPDIVLLDVSMPGQSGFVVARRLRENQTQVKILIISDHTEKAYIDEAKRIGVAGYVPKRHCTRVEEAIDVIIRGEAYFPQELMAS